MKQLYRPRSNRVFAGVCSGIGKYIGIDPVFVRLGFIFAFFSGAGFLAYLVLCVLMPSEDSFNYSSGRPKVYIRRNARQTVDVPVASKRKRKNDEEVIHYARPVRDNSRRDDFYDDL